MSWILGLITMQALFTVGGFAVLPNWARAVGIFLGSFPGSWVYCVVFRYLEGRRTTELLNSVITLSIVFAGASARSVGSSMIDAGLPEDWMPLVAAGSIFPISVVAFLVLDRMPGQSKAEQDGRSERRAMGADERAAFIARFWPGIALLLLNCKRRRRRRLGHLSTCPMTHSMSPAPIVSHLRTEVLKPR